VSTQAINLTDHYVVFLFSRASHPRSGLHYLHGRVARPVSRQQELYSSIPILAVSMCAVIGYGWVIEGHVHPAIMLLQAYLGCKCTPLHQTYSALIVGVFPDKPGTAAAANNITRCMLATAAVAILDPLSRALGYGGVGVYYVAGAV